MSFFTAANVKKNPENVYLWGKGLAVRDRNLVFHADLGLGGIALAEVLDLEEVSFVQGIGSHEHARGPIVVNEVGQHPVPPKSGGPGQLQ